MLTKKWLEKEIELLKDQKVKAENRLKRATARVNEALVEQEDAEEHRYAILAWIEAYEWHLGHFDDETATEYNGEGG